MTGREYNTAQTPVDNVVSIWYIYCTNGCPPETQMEVNTMGNISFVSFRELRTSTSRINEMLTDGGRIIVTNNGKPKALMIQVSETDFEETLAVLNQVKLTRAISSIRAAAQRSGADQMTLDEINAEILQSRKERKGQAARGVESD